MTVLVRALPRTLGLRSSRCLASRGTFRSRNVGIRRATSAADLRFGQPLHETHPHLLQPGELTPGITALEYAQRRDNLARALPDNGVAILAAADTKYRSGSVFYKFHQDPNFFYLTGFNEPNALAVIEKTNSEVAHHFHLYVRSKDPKDEKWEGTRSGIQAAQDVFNADEAGDIDEIMTTLANIIDGRREIFSDIPSELKGKSTFSKVVLGTGSPMAENVGELLQKKTVKPLRPLVNNLRVTKSEAEIRNMMVAGQASGRAFTEAMKQRFLTERDLETFLDYKFKFNGCEESAYVPVIAGGENALQIHYVRNDDVLEDGNLLTVDAGGEYGSYVTDITRTWPVNGKFTAPQRDLYEMILRVQQTCVSLCREDANVSLDKLHSIAEEGLKDGLLRLGFDLSNNGMYDLFPHHVGHYLGLAIHDAPGHSRTGKLKEGQCITIEPGVYVENSERWPKHFRGLGIRIEDSVCIGEDRPLVLTSEAIKEVADIEALRE